MEYKIISEIIDQDFETSSILYVPDKNSFYLLEDTSYELWQHIKNNKTKNEIIELMTKKYEVETSIIVEDFEKFIIYLIKIGAIGK